MRGECTNTWIMGSAFNYILLLFARHVIMQERTICPISNKPIMYVSTDSFMCGYYWFRFQNWRITDPVIDVIQRRLLIFIVLWPLLEYIAKVYSVCEIIMHFIWVPLKIKIKIIFFHTICKAVAYRTVFGKKLFTYCDVYWVYNSSDQLLLC